MAFNRLPNGLGTISKLKQNLRNPYRARKLVGEVFDDKTLKVKRVYRTIGYFKTRKEAMQALILDNGFSKTDEVISFRMIYEKWSETKYAEISASLRSNYERAFRRFEPIHEQNFASLRVLDYEEVIDDSVPPSMKKVCKVLLSQLYQYAVRHDICDRDYSALVRFDTSKAEHKAKRPFTVDEVKRIWERQGELAADMVLVGLFSGLRPTELLTLDRTKIQHNCFIGGIKTENGRNRLVPIHPCILPIVERYARKSAFLRSTTLFPNESGKPYDLSDWRRRIFSPLCPDHSPHEMRHSFATYARRSGMDPVIIKRILGHSLKDMTEEVYTHIDADILHNEMAKFRIQ